MAHTPGQGDFVLITDRGGHLHNALMLVGQMQARPDAVLTTAGPEVTMLRREYGEVVVLPYLFTWLGKKRLLNPFNVFMQCMISLFHALRLRPKAVISLGATDVVFFCYWARLFGAEIYHVECMNQVWTPSVTGRMLYPICSRLFVQWEELLKHYGPKAEYAGWVL